MVHGSHHRTIIVVENDIIVSHIFIEIRHINRIFINFVNTITILVSPIVECPYVGNSRFPGGCFSRIYRRFASIDFDYLQDFGTVQECDSVFVILFGRIRSNIRSISCNPGYFGNPAFKCMPRPFRICRQDNVFGLRSVVVFLGTYRTAIVVHELDRIFNASRIKDRIIIDIACYRRQGRQIFNRAFFSTYLYAPSLERVRVFF